MTCAGMCNGRSRAGGYTLIELLVVLLILGTLSGLALPLAQVSAQRERERELKAALWAIREAIDAYKRTGDALATQRNPLRSGYPANLQALVDGLPDPERPGQLRRFLRDVPRDPFADPALPAESTWRLRSYASPADDPQPGEDIYDVHSGSDLSALNGSALRSW